MAPRSRTSACKTADYCGGLDLMKDQRGNNDLLNLTRPGAGALDLRRLRRCRRRDPRHQHLQRQRHQPGRLWRRGFRRADQPRLGRNHPRGRRSLFRERRQGPLGRRRARADQQDPVAFAQRQRSRFPRSRLSTRSRPSIASRSTRWSTAASTSSWSRPSSTRSTPRPRSWRRWRRSRRSAASCR